MFKTIFDVCDYLDEQDWKRRRRNDEDDSGMVALVNITSVSTRSEKLLYRRCEEDYLRDLAFNAWVF